jgi:hypothetical protein
MCETSSSSTRRVISTSWCASKSCKEGGRRPGPRGLRLAPDSPAPAVDTVCPSLGWAQGGKLEFSPRSAPGHPPFTGLTTYGSSHYCPRARTLTSGTSEPSRDLDQLYFHGGLAWKPSWVCYRVQLGEYACEVRGSGPPLLLTLLHALPSQEHGPLGARRLSAGFGIAEVVTLRVGRWYTGLLSTWACLPHPWAGRPCDAWAECELVSLSSLPGWTSPLESPRCSSPSQVGFYTGTWVWQLSPPLTPLIHPFSILEWSPGPLECLT